MAGSKAWGGLLQVYSFVMLAYRKEVPASCQFLRVCRPRPGVVNIACASVFPLLLLGVCSKRSLGRSGFCNSHESLAAVSERGDVPKRSIRKHSH